jgi:hypothetical protein
LVVTQEGRNMKQPITDESEMTEVTEPAALSERTLESVSGAGLSRLTEEEQRAARQNEEYLARK